MARSVSILAMLVVIGLGISQADESNRTVVSSRNPVTTMITNIINSFSNHTVITRPVSCGHDPTY